MSRTKHEDFINTLRFYLFTYLPERRYIPLKGTMSKVGTFNLSTFNLVPTNNPVQSPEHPAKSFFQCLIAHITDLNYLESQYSTVLNISR